jgi:hypothetical protein
LHEDEFDVVFDDGIGFVGFAEESAAAGDFILGVGDLVPDDRGEVVEANCFAMFLNRGVKRNNSVPAVVLFARETDIADVDDQSSAGN